MTNFEMRKELKIILLISLISFSNCSSTPIIKPNIDKYDDDAKNKMNQELGLIKEGCQVVFLGDSITQEWAGPGIDTWNQYYDSPYSAWNYGVSGDFIQNLLYRLNMIEIKTIKPKLVLILIGVNNINYDYAQANEIPIGINAVVLKVKNLWPDAKILLQTIWSSRDHEIIDEANIYIQKMADQSRNVFVADTHEIFKNGDGTRDGIHPDSEGYKTYAIYLQPYIKNLMNEISKDE